MSDNNQILRLLATIREECAAVRSRQEELYEILISYKDQIQDLKQTVIEKLAGLPKSPYIAGQLVPAPRKNAGVDEYRELLATYLHKAENGAADETDERPVDLVWDKPPEVKPDDIPLEEDEDDRPRHRSGGGGGGGGGGRSPRRDNDLERGPDRDIEPIDLDDDEDEDEDEADGEGDEGAGGGAAPRRRKRRRRGGRGRRKEGSAGGERGERQASPSSADPGEAPTPAGDPPA